MPHLQPQSAFCERAHPESRRYAARGVDAIKGDLHRALRHAPEGLYPEAFCQLVADPWGSQAHCLAMHADGVGSKSIVAYLAYRETGDPEVFRSLAQDAVVMNTDDLLCVGAKGPFLLSNTIARNARLIPGEVLEAIFQGYADQVRQFAEWDVEIVLAGGETADLGDAVRTLVLDASMMTRLPRSEVIRGSFRPGDVIIGLASGGQASFEKRENSGIGSNGLTSARHELLHADYGRRYPESCDPQIEPALRYNGPHRLSDPLPGSTLSIGEALLSPTRSYVPIVLPLLEDAEVRRGISAIIHCTGSGRHKAARFARGVRLVRDNPFHPPPLFERIQHLSQASSEEMDTVFNMGQRLEIFARPELFSVVQEHAARFGVEARRVGYCEALSDPEAPAEVHIATPA